MKGDPEILAISTCHEALASLSGSARKRVISWLTEKFGSVPEKREPEPTTDNDSGGTEREGPASVEDVAEGFANAFGKAKPKTAADKVLFTAWFLSEKMGEKDLTSLRINSMLTHLGHKPTNASAEVRRLTASQPALMIQMRKQGKSKQARKLLRVSEEGKEAARKMLEAPSGNDPE